ncbi:MAG: ATP-binding cassette domain-containing protein [Candidatus Lokiarchaeota archaeon]
MDQNSSEKFNLSPQEDIYDPNENFAIVIEDLAKQFGDIKAVNGLSFKVREGEIFGLLGPNGAGKTTTINMMNGLLKPDRGQIYVGGYDVSKDLKEIKKVIGVCPQHIAIYKFLTGRENIELFGTLYGMKKEDVRQRTDTLINAVDFVETSKRKAKTYSGGMLSQLNLLMALINDPEIAFLDEPTVGMDPRARRKMWQFIGSLKEQNKTVILTTHYIEEAEALSDMVAIIDYGELIALGSPQDLMENYKAKNLEEVFLEITGRRILEGI